ncbi:MAG: VPLPA-CTERM sorting domain-containing protein, partial [Xanthobacteraceae bacterium]
TSSDYVTVTFTTADALADNLNSVLIDATSFTFQDGVQTLSNTDASGTFVISTDAVGDITSWLLTADIPGSYYLIRTSNLAVTDGVFDVGTFGTIDNTLNEGFNTEDTGVWTPSTTPLPAALPLFASGLGAIGLLGWRRKRKAQAAA